MRPRKALAIAIGLFVTTFALYALFPRFRNGFSCNSSVPSNSAEAAGLEDARFRKANVCSRSKQLCQFGIYADIDGTFRVSLYFVETDFFEGCVQQEQDLEVFVYSREGTFLRTEEAPYD
jgi:hypothetical protein